MSRTITQPHATNSVHDGTRRQTQQKPHTGTLAARAVDQTGEPPRRTNQVAHVAHTHAPFSRRSIGKVEQLPGCTNSVVGEVRKCVVDRENCLLSCQGTGVSTPALEPLQALLGRMRGGDVVRAER